uniref:phospholipase D n=1 Tax=Arcella intermedia TaxID=1963864 RepID=A0A6B2KZ92_9EUKA
MEKDKGNSLINRSLQYITQKDKRWFYLRHGFLAYFKHENDENPISCITLNSAATRIITDTALYLESNTFTRTIYFKDRAELSDWLELLRVHSTATLHNRFKSFAPVRRMCRAAHFINGENYFRNLVPLIDAAKKRIYITDWYLSPGLYLTRNRKTMKEHRLDKLLFKKAAEGVQIYILIWNASQVFELNPTYVLDLFNKKTNIIALSHPPLVPVSWSHHQKIVVIDEEIATLGGIDLAYGRYETNDYPLTDPDEDLFPGRDYMNSNWDVGESNGPTHEPTIPDRSKMHRMPWHDIQMAVDGLAAKDVARNFIERWNWAMSGSDNPPKGVKTYIFPLPNVENLSMSTILYNNVYNNCNCQIVRSVSYWSAGVSTTEQSIYKAYINAINNAQKYIMIINQYFITSIDRAVPSNRILSALYQRLRNAIKNKENFKVIVVIPLWSAGDVTAPTTLYIIKYTLKAINLQPNSLLNKLKAEFPDVDLNDYITFHSLRNYGVLAGKPVYEQIYVHSKTIIVDDRLVIIGSANINDRSMVGVRDTEICCVVEQDDWETITTETESFKVSKFAYDLRMRLLSSYLKLSLQDTRNIFADIWNLPTYSRLKAYSTINTKIYQSVFRLVPDNVTSIEQLSKIHPKSPEFAQNTVYNWQEQLMGLQGHLIDYPLEFLKNASNLSPSITQKEFVVKQIQRNIFL